MKLRFIVVGRLSSDWLRTGFAEYTKNLKALGVEVEVLEIAETKGDRLKCRKEESQKILKTLKSPSIVFDKSGENLTSEDLAFDFQKMFLKTGRADLVIGGSHGLEESLLDKADYIVSFGKNTFPHQLFRIMAIEQIYRAMTIYKGKEYHK